MAISRSLMNRQLQADGGIMQVAPREKFGLGSKLKKFVRKIIPNEIADVATSAAPFVAPFNPALAGVMSGLGSFDQTGSIGDSLKGGALTYGLGQAARYLGGAELQTGNPFTSGGAFTPSGFKAGFSMPFATSVPSVGEGLNSAVESNLLMGDPTATGMNLTGSSAVSSSPAASVGNQALNLLKKGSKAVFMKPGPNGVPIVDKAAVIGAATFALSYAEAKALAGENGVELTEDEYNQAQADDVQKEYAGYLENFLGETEENRANGGRIGFESGANEMIKNELMEGIMGEITEDEMITIMTENGPIQIKRSVYESMPQMFMDTTTSAYGDAGRGRPIPEFANGGRIGRKFGSPEEGESEVGIMAIDVEAGDDEDEEDMMMAGGINFSRAEKAYLFKRLGGGGGADRSYTMPSLYRILSNPNRYPRDARILKEIVTINLGEGQKDGGRIGFESGANEMIKKKLMMELGLYPSPEKESSGGIGLYPSPEEESSGGIGLYPSPITKEDSEIIMTKNGPISIKEIFEKDTPLSEDLLGMSEGFTLSPVTLLRRYLANKELQNKADGGRIGYAKGANRVSELLILRDEKIANGEDVSDIEGEIFQLTGKTFKSVGGISDIPTGNMRKNNAGVVERDYRDEGGFVPVGIKERADDVPAMLSKNEFVMTADAVRGIGNGSVEEGSKKLYNTMKQAEQKGKIA